MTQRPLFALLAACSLFACGKVSNLGYGRDSANDGAGNSGVVDPSTAGGSSGVAGSADADGGLVDPGCDSAVSVDGDLELNSDSTTTQLVREVTGDLKIDSPTADLPELRCLEAVGGNLDVLVETGDLSALGQLRSVHFNLTIHGNREMRDLSALRSLSSVGTTLTIADNDALVDLSGLESLTDVFELHIRNNPKLEHLDALSNLTSRGGDLEIAGCDALVNLDGLHQFSQANRVNISQNPLLRDLAGLDGLSAAYDISIVGNDALVDLSALAGIKSVNQLILSDNPALANLAGFANLAKADTLELRNNLALENIDALSTSLTSLGTFELDGCPKVSTLEGLSNITSMREIGLTSSGVNTLNGVRNVEQLLSLYIGAIEIKDFTGLDKALINGSINVVQAGELESLSGLSPDIHELGAIMLQDNPKLHDLAGLGMLQSLNMLTIQSSPQLERLTGLENLTQLEHLVITDSGLTSLTPLDSLPSISGDADIERNTKLSACDIQAFVTRTGVVTSTLESNGPCN